MFHGKRLTRICGLLTALMLGGAMLTGCYKGDGTEVRVRRNAKLQDNPDADAIAATFTNVTVDVNARTDYPFTFEPVTENPVQEIAMVMIFDKPDKVAPEQAVNYFDASGNCYRYWHPVDADGDFMTPLLEDFRNGGTVVSIMGEPERETVRYLAAHVSDYSKLNLKQQDAGSVYGTTSLYLIDKRGEPLLIGRHADTSEYRDSSEIVAFLNWFSYYYLGDFKFGG